MNIRIYLSILLAVLSFQGYTQTSFYFGLGVDAANPQSRVGRVDGFFFSTADPFSSFAPVVNFCVKKRVSDNLLVRINSGYSGHKFSGGIPLSFILFEEYGFRRFRISPGVEYALNDKIGFGIGPEFTYLFDHFLRPGGVSRDNTIYDRPDLNNFQLGIIPGVELTIRSLYIRTYASIGVILFDDKKYTDYILPLKSYGLQVGVIL